MFEASDVSGQSVDLRQGRLSNWARIGLAAAFAVLVCIRMPDILLEGRFWAEEGNKFFENAWLLRWPAALLAPWGGYLNLTANLAGILAWNMPRLAWAPYASTLLALAFQLCPAILLLTSRTAWLERPLVLLAGLLLIATPPSTEEVWLSSIGSQVHLTLCAALILALGTCGGAVGLFRLALLALAALSGPGPWVLAPLFAARAVFDRSWQRALQTGVLGACVLIQVVFFYSHQAGRTYAVHPVLFLDIAFVKHVLIPFLGPRLAYRVISAIRASGSPRHLAWWPALLMAAITVVAARVLAPAWRREPFWMALAAVMLAAVAYYGSLGGADDMLDFANGERYAFVPQVLIGLALLGCAAMRLGVVRRVASVLVVWLLIVGLLNYASPLAYTFAHGPSWRVELALHRLDPGHVVAGWPNGWTVPLPPGPLAR